MSKRKKLLLLLIVLFPSAFWLILETSTINSKKLPFYGPKKAEGKDTAYYSVNTIFLNAKGERKLYDTINYPFLMVTFLKPQYARDGFRLQSLTDYTQHETKDVDKLPFLIAYPLEGETAVNIKDTLKIGLNNIEQVYWRSSSYDSLNLAYFKEKPVYVDYSFIILLDKQRHIRGYYDGRYVSEVKRLLGEYKHIRLKEEKKTLIKENEIKTNSK